MKATDVIDRQVDAYNAHDLDAFCTWYGEDIKIWNLGEPEPFIRSMADLRNVYGKKFENPMLRTQVMNRIVMGKYIVDHERITGIGTAPAEATVIYVVYEDLIQQVHIMRP